MSERFKLARASELQPDLVVTDEASKKGKSARARKAALKRVVANMTMSNLEMMQLFPEIIQCMTINDIEVKRMCFLYLETYAKARPNHALEALGVLVKEVSGGNGSGSSLARALALRTLSSVPSKAYVRETIKHIRSCLNDQDVYVRKTTALAISKAWTADPEATERAGLITALNKLLISDASPTVVSAAVEALMEVTNNSTKLDFVVDRRTALTLARILTECTEWAKAVILSALIRFVPQSAAEAEELIRLVAPQSQHSNSAVILGVARLAIYLANYSPNIDIRKLVSAPMVSQLAPRLPEIQYVVLRNILLLSQNYADLFSADISHFYYSVADPEYVKIVKVQILCELATAKNYQTVLAELKEVARAKTAGESPARRAVSVIGRVAVRIPDAVGDCLRALGRLLSSPQVHVVQEAVASVVHIVKRYPQTIEATEFQSVINEIWNIDRKDITDRNERSQCSLLWLIGHFPLSFPHPRVVLGDIITDWEQLPPAVQMASLTAATKLYIALPHEMSPSIVPKIYELAQKTATNPDLRDRAWLYSRLYSATAGNIEVAREIVAGKEPATEDDEPIFEQSALEELQLSLGYLSSVYLKPASQLFRVAKPPVVAPSPALLPRNLHLNAKNDAKGSSVNASLARMSLTQNLNQNQSQSQSQSQSHSHVPFTHPNGSGSFAIPNGFDGHNGLSGLNGLNGSSSVQAKSSAPLPPPTRLSRTTSVLYQQPMSTGQHSTLGSVEETSAIFEEDERLIDI